MTTAIAFLCKYYSFSFKDVMNLTLIQFQIFLHEAGIINKLESGEKEEIPLTGKAGAIAAMHLLPRKENIYGK